LPIALVELTVNVRTLDPVPPEVNVTVPGFREAVIPVIDDVEMLMVPA
jgi:hypothetical protein